MSIFKNRRLDLKIHSSFISFGEMEQNGLLLFLLKITIKSSHKRRAARSGDLFAKDVPNKERAY
jgi:hypothetical protein